MGGMFYRPEYIGAHVMVTRLFLMLEPKAQEEIRKAGKLLVWCNEAGSGDASLRAEIVPFDDPLADHIHEDRSGAHPPIQIFYPDADGYFELEAVMFKNEVMALLKSKGWNRDLAYNGTRVRPPEEVTAS